MPSKEQAQQQYEAYHIATTYPQLLKACQAAYRKHHLGDESIGWDELSNILSDALSNAMGAFTFDMWAKSHFEALRGDANDGD